ncbi:zinc-finger domain-containing protein [Wolbachia endosymbiont of Atemnus politus]|uniref:zinc-finger domain-containing protein n=1 Tax=Wolbachia endosymbiont of Atemnus politus TaxID=2682840 RepID=UPI0015729036|nr:zinc-finger domain-containing protein [Wolbachia endosymbiont of Atemnus politus]NSM56395.1 zinc-finger domain-containing protein [Wolbachia endosymbiont of Atemnus politus]NSX83636.1 zinc-finger domain-containing protein [Wolbachia endosymbiont of Atemnus politus]
MTEVRDNSIIVCCRGDEDDEGSGHPLIYLHKEEEETFCPYCSKPMDEEFKSEELKSKEFKPKEFKSVEKCIVAAANKRERTHG